MLDRPTYDLAERERIRRELLLYKERHGIGAIKMSRLISDAHPNKPIIPHRRLSRYLAKQHQPENIFVGWCDRFLRTLPKEDDPVWLLARGLLSFCPTQSGPDYTGVFSLHLMSSVEANPDPPSARITITRDDNFWRVEERVIHRNAICDGALIGTAGYGFAVLKDRLTNRIKSYIVRMDNNKYLGHSQGVSFMGQHHEYMFKLEKLNG